MSQDEQPRVPINFCYNCACWVPLEDDNRFGHCMSSPPVVVVKNGSSVTRYPVTAKVDGCNTGFVGRNLEKPATLCELADRIAKKPRAMPLYEGSKYVESRPSPASLAELMGREPRHPTVGTNEIMAKAYEKHWKKEEAKK